MADTIRRIPFLGQHINLAAIQSVSDAHFIDRMGTGGWFVGLTIGMELVDTPLVFEWDADELGGVRFVSGTGHQVQFIDGEWGTPSERPVADLVPVRNLQRWVDEQLLPPWREARGEAPDTRPPWRSHTRISREGGHMGTSTVGRAALGFVRSVRAPVGSLDDGEVDTIALETNDAGELRLTIRRV